MLSWYLCKHSLNPMLWVLGVGGKVRILEHAKCPFSRTLVIIFFLFTYQTRKISFRGLEEIWRGCEMEEPRSERTNEIKENATRRQRSKEIKVEFVHNFVHIFETLHCLKRREWKLYGFLSVALEYQAFGRFCYFDKS